MLKRIFSSELAKGSFTLLIMINIYNFVNYLFHFITARMLGPADYGVLAVLISFTNIFSIPSEAIQAIVSRSTSTYNLKKEPGKINALLSGFLKRGIQASILSFILFSILAVYLSATLHIPYSLFFLTGFVIFGIFLIPSVRGVLQGRKQFKECNQKVNYGVCKYDVKDFKHKIKWLYGQMATWLLC